MALELNGNVIANGGMPKPINQDSSRFHTNKTQNHIFSTELNSIRSSDVDSLEFAEKMDKDDPLKEFRKRFYYPKKKDLPDVDIDELASADEEGIYFCGHSLGLQLRSVGIYLDDIMKNWAERGVHSHFYGSLPVAFCDLPLKEKMAELVGSEPDEIAVMNGLTVNIHIMLSSFYQPTASRYKILMIDHGFPSDLYAVQSQVRLRGYDPEDSLIFLKPRLGEHLINPKDVISVIEEQGSSISVIFLEGVHYYTGQLFDMKNITRVGHKMGCMVGFDLAHGAGNVKLQLHDWDVDFALWCTYKYMNCGAGSLSSIFVHNKFTKNGVTDTFPMLRGWWGVNTKTKFAMKKEFEPAEGADRFKLSNPSPFLAGMVLANIEVFHEAGIDRLVQKQQLLTGYLEFLLTKHFPPNSKESGVPHIALITPSNPKLRGCQISLMSSIPLNKLEHQLRRKGIVCDIRLPSVIRVTPVPLYNTFEEVYRFVHTLKDIFIGLTHQNG